ncbi:MAG: aminotransferase class V-fold PLP-dependent enzyme [Gammaproteobacteria bacterium]
MVFTSSGTESNHLAILGALAMRPDRRHVITSEVEHPSTLMLFRHLETHGVRVTYLPVDGDGRLAIDALDDTFSPDTALVSLMWANNETGVLFPIARAAEMARARGVLFHTDAVQAVGKEPIDLRQVPVDMLSLSGHKLYAPAGIGALCVRKGLKLPPILFGHQERGRRAGTENVAGIAALGVACAKASASLATEPARLAALRDQLETGVLSFAPYARVNGARATRVANTSNVRFGDFDAELILGRLDRLGICASAGAACSSAGTKPSHVLTAMGLSVSAALASIRFSLGRHNTKQEVDSLLHALAQILDEPVLRTAVLRTA